jgi:hypothetical protein
MNQKQHKQSYGSAAIQDVILGIKSSAHFTCLSSNHSHHPSVLSALSVPIAVKTRAPIESDRIGFLQIRFDQNSTNSIEYSIKSNSRDQKSRIRA